MVRLGSRVRIVALRALLKTQIIIIPHSKASGRATHNHLHNHAGSILSGVYYVNSTPEQGNIFFERSDNAEYFLPPVEKPNYFTSTATTYKAITGALYVFPGWMKHSVQPNTTDKDRISVSFNYGVNNANRT